MIKKKDFVSSHILSWDIQVRHKPDKPDKKSDLVSDMSGLVSDVSDMGSDLSDMGSDMSDMVSGLVSDVPYVGKMRRAWSPTTDLCLI